MPKNLSGEQQTAAAFRELIYRPESPIKGGCLVKVPSKTSNRIYVHSDKSAAHIQKS